MIADFGNIVLMHSVCDRTWKVAQPRVSRMIKMLSLQTKASKKFKVTKDSNHNKEVANNLLDQNFNDLDVNHRWVTDITYIPTQ